MVVSAIIAATTKHGFARKPGLTVYHVTSSVANPLLFRVFTNSCYEHFKSSPMKDVKGKPVYVERVKFLSSLEDILSYISEAIIQQNGVKSSQRLRSKFSEKMIEQTIQMIKTYEPYYISRWFDSSNTYRLWEAMSETEKLNFGFDVKSLDWKDYFANIHVPGLRKFVMNGR